MRDPQKLRAFELADALALTVYQVTKSFPRAEQFGMTAQLRRSAVSVPSNIVEGCARDTEADYLCFLDIAYGSAKELAYQLSLAHRLGFLPAAEYASTHARAEETCKVLAGLLRSLRRPARR